MTLVDKEKKNNNSIFFRFDYPDMFFLFFALQYDFSDENVVEQIVKMSNQKPEVLNFSPVR